jgi:hypothetical protein
MYGVVETFSQLEAIFPGRGFQGTDVELFLNGIRLLSEGKLDFQPSKKTKAELLTLLRKIHWAHRELTRIAGRTARAIGEKDPDSIRSQFYELAALADSADKITQDDVKTFIIGTPERDTRPGAS